MSDIILNHIATINDISIINSNFDIIEASINTDVVHTAGGQNVMQQDLDMNGHKILNTIVSLTEEVDQLSVTGDNQSTSPTTGSLRTNGGLGVAKDIYCGGVYHGDISTNGGTIDNTQIGQNTPSSGTFTTLSAIAINNTPIGVVFPSTGNFTNLNATGTLTGFSGRLLNVQVFNANATYVPTPGTTSIIVEACGAGGGGGGAAATGSNQSAAAAGGGGGSYAKIYLTTVPASVVMNIPAGGTGGTGSNAGSTPSDLTFGSILTCPSGIGGVASAAFGNVGFSTGIPVAANAPTVNGALTITKSTGSFGHHGMVLVPGTVQVSGEGGSTIFGIGGVQRGASQAGQSSNNHGTGGSGACNAQIQTTLQTGGTGGTGVVIIYEFSS